MTMTGLLNLRPLKAAAFLRDGPPPAYRVYRSAALSLYGGENIGRLQDALRIDSYVDLRSEAERAHDSQDCRRSVQGFRHVAFHPITTRVAPPSSATPTSADYLPYYRSMLENAPTFARAFVTVGEYAEQGGVAFGCSQGKDRTGLLAAALLEAAGCSREQILQDYATSLEELSRSELLSPEYWEARGLTREAYMRRFQLGDGPLRLLLDDLQSGGRTLLDLFREHAPDRSRFRAAELRMATSPGTSRA
jgi:hypothetical protein